MLFEHNDILELMRVRINGVAPSQFFAKLFLIHLGLSREFEKFAPSPGVSRVGSRACEICLFHYLREKLDPELEK